MSAPIRLARFGLDGSEKWIPQLAEELGTMIEAGANPGLVSLKVREAAKEHGIADLWLVTQLVAREWDRLGMARIPRTFQAGGW